LTQSVSDNAAKSPVSNPSTTRNPYAPRFTRNPPGDGEIQGIEQEHGHRGDSVRRTMLRDIRACDRG
jgi:hypothetical protein